MSESRQTPALFDYFPKLNDRLSWIRLGELPTPVHRLLNIGIENLWIKRDDQTSPIYGGNKVRKLEFSLADILRRKKKKVVTVGAIGTNHGLATAIFCKKLGLECTLLLFEQPVTKNVKQNLKLFHRYGAKIVYKGSMLKTALNYFVSYRLFHPTSFFLYGGGSSVEGTMGYVNAALELKTQIDMGLIPEPDRIFCPFGTGGTLAGLTLGIRLAGLKTIVSGVRVTDAQLGPIHIATSKSVASLIQAVYSKLKCLDPGLLNVSLQSPPILHNFFGEAYGKVTKEGIDAIRLLREKESIELDPTYTSKAFAAVLEHCKNRTSPKETVLYWHTYNSVDLSHQAELVNITELPKNARRFFNE